MISVIMPAHNAEKFIKPAIESILDQTYKDLELIVVDDGSTDNTVEIVKTYVAEDDRVQLIQNQHGGANKARNTAIEAAQYPWIACMDADDVAHPQRLEKQLKMLQAHPEIVVLGSYMEQIDGEGNVIGHGRFGPTSVEEFNALDRTKHVAVIVNPTAMFNRDIAMKVGCYNERITAAQEVELWDRMSEYGALVVIPEPLLQYRIHGDSVSVNKYFDQRMYHNFITARYRARQEGKQLTLEQFLHDYKNIPAPRRLIRHIRHRGGLYYRLAGVNVAKKNYPMAAIYVVLAVIIRPRFAIKRILNRYFPERFPRQS